MNTSSTRIELVWNVAESPSITDDQRAVLLDRLGRRIDSRGALHLFGSGSRSQHQNREAVQKRFVSLVAAALKPRRKRKKTVPPASAVEERLRSKKRRGEIKRRRGRPSLDD